MAYSNLIKELWLFNAYNLTKIWDEHLRFLEANDEQRINPDAHPGFRRTLGPDWSALPLDNGLIGVTLHFGAYRHATRKFIATIRNQYPSKPIALVVDQESFQTEQRLEKWNHVLEELNVQYVIAEHATSALRLVRHLKKGGVVVIYLDGLTGVGQDDSPIAVPFISHPIHLRRGLFHLASKTGTPTVAFVPESGDTIVYSAPLTNPTPEALAQSIMAFFRRSLLLRPAQWRLWYRHHRYVSYPPVLKPIQPNAPTMIRCTELSPALLLDINTGEIYEDMD